MKQGIPVRLHLLHTCRQLLNPSTHLPGVLLETQRSALSNLVHLDMRHIQNEL